MGRDLVAEASADVLRDDAELVESDSHRRPHHDRGETRELVVRVQRPLAGTAVVLDERAVAFEGRRVEPVEVQLTDRDDVVRLRERRVDVAPLPDAGVREIAAAVLVEHRCAVLQRDARVDDDIERLVVDQHQFCRIARELAALGDDRHDCLTDVADLADRECVVLHVPAGRRRDLEEGVRQDRHLVAGQRPVHAGQLEGRRDVDRLDPRMRVRRADEVEIAHPVALDVVDEDTLALDESPVFLPGNALTHGETLLQDACLGLDGGHPPPPSPAATTASTMFQ